MRQALLVGMLAVSLSGCLHTTFTTGKPRSTRRESGSNNFFLWGLANTSHTDLPEVCPDGVSKFTVYESFPDGFLGVITLGIYTPRSWEADCASGEGADHAGAPASKEVAP